MKEVKFQQQDMALTGDATAPAGTTSAAASLTQLSQAQTMAATTPKFGALTDSIPRVAKFLLPSLPIFSAISSIFIVEFLAQDIVGMWFPRIGVSLKRGAEPYDIWKDPTAQGLSPLQFGVKNFVESGKRLNWPNFVEEAGREFATGPGILMLPTAVYALFRAFSTGKSVMQMGLGDIRDYKNTLVHYFGEMPAADFAQKSQVRNTFESYLNKLFQIPANESVLSQKVFASEAFVKSFGPLTAQEQNLTVGQLVQKWSGLMAESLEHEISQPGGWRGNLQKLGHEFRWIPDLISLPLKALDKVFHLSAPKPLNSVQLRSQNIKRVQALLADSFKEAHRMNPDLLYDLENVAIGVAKKGMEPHSLKVVGAGSGVVRQGIDSIFSNVDHLKDFVTGVFRASQENMAGQSGKLADLVEGVYRKVANQKSIISIGLTLLGGWYMFWLSHKVQSHKAYPANRLLDLNALHNHPAPSPMAQMGGPVGGNPLNGNPMGYGFNQQPGAMAYRPMFRGTAMAQPRPLPSATPFRMGNPGGAI